MVDLRKAYANKRVLVTGHTGFKGSWLCLWLKILGAEVAGISLPDLPSNPSHYSALKGLDLDHDYRFDIRDQEKVGDVIQGFRPEFIFHLAAQPIVKFSFEQPMTTWTTNVGGTLSILEALHKVSWSCCAVMITSDKCYRNLEWVWGYRESDRLGGNDPYGASKAAADIMISSYCESLINQKLVRVGIGRAGNVIGGGDWAPDRIVPDCITKWRAGLPLELRNPNATRPWQHVLEPLSGYLALGAKLYSSTKFHGEAFNFGPSEISESTVVDLVEKMAERCSKRFVTSYTVTEESIPEAQFLKLCCDKASRLLEWSSSLNLNETIDLTTEWYLQFDGHDSTELSTKQIHWYTDISAKRERGWLA